MDAPTIETVPIDQILLAPECQAREQVRRATIREYVDAMKGGAHFPPLTVFRDVAGRMWLADGFQRLAACVDLALPSVEVEIFFGEKRDALQYALSANSKHGVRRTTADKRKAVLIALADEEWRGWSDRKLADLCGCDHKTVGKIRREKVEVGISPVGQATFDEIRKGEDGRVRRMPRRSKTVSEPSAAVAGANANSVLGGAGALAHKVNPMLIGDEVDADFNIVTEMKDLEWFLDRKFKGWPKEKRHAYCVALREFAIGHSPEVKQMATLAFDDVLTRKEGDDQ